MTRVSLDNASAIKFSGQTDLVEVCDESGRRLGFFQPTTDDLRAVYDWANSEITDAELEQAAQEPGGRTLAEIWARLGRS